MRMCNTLTHTDPYVAMHAVSNISWRTEMPVLPTLPLGHPFQGAGFAKWGLATFIRSRICRSRICMCLSVCVPVYAAVCENVQVLCISKSAAAEAATTAEATTTTIAVAFVLIN